MDLFNCNNNNMNNELTLNSYYSNSDNFKGGLGPCFTKMQNRSWRTYRIPDSLNYNYLPYGWQRPDYRPWHYLVNTRQNVKDFCRMSPEDYMGDCNCNNRRWKCMMDFVYPRHDPCQYNKPCHSTNTVNKLV